MNYNDIISETKTEIKTNKRFKPILLWALVSFIGVMVIKAIRFQHLHLSPTADLLQGILPNFFAGTGICALFFIYYPIFQLKQNDLITRITFSSIFSFVGLTLWEIIQWTMGYNIDICDIGMSALGSTLTFLFIYWVVKHK